MSLKLLAEKANSADPDQTAPQEQSDLGLHCLPKDLCLKILDKNEVYIEPEVLGSIPNFATYLCFP